MYAKFKINECQHGQALTEFLAWCVALLPLLLALPLLGKLADMNQMAIQASRYVAWERTITTTKENWKSDLQLEDEVRGRIFANIGRPIKSGDVVKDSSTSDHNGFIHPYGGNALITSINDVTVKSNQSELAPGTKGKVLSTFNASYFGLPTDNLWRGEVNVAISNMPFVGALNLKINRHNTILVDAWDAGSRENEIAAMKKSTVMTDSPLVKAWAWGDTANALMNTVEPAFKEFELGHIGPDPLPVPKDRL